MDNSLGKTANAVLQRALLTILAVEWFVEGLEISTLAADHDNQARYAKTFYRSKTLSRMKLLVPVLRLRLLPQ